MNSSSDRAGSGVLTEQSTNHASALRDALETVVRQCGDRLTEASGGNTALLPHIRDLLAEVSPEANLASTLNREAARYRFFRDHSRRWCNRLQYAVVETDGVVGESLDMRGNELDRAIDRAMEIAGVKVPYGKQESA